MNKRKGVAAIYVVCAVIFFIYYLLRLQEYSYVREIDTKDYLINENACYEIEYTWYGDSYMGMVGYFYWYGDVERPWNCTVALLDTVSNVMYEVPTQFMEREDEKEKYSPVSHFGFVCHINTNKVDLDGRRYQLCFLDKGDGESGVITHMDEYVGKEEN
nr:hypothetical protein [Lachnospiraceae bacterium]